MTLLDYVIIGLYLAAILAMGAYFSGQQTSLKEFFLGSRNIPWWAAAFSGIATVVSAAAYLGAPGQAFQADLTFLQYRLATPFAIAIICLLLIPFFYRLELFTAYEYLERRFDLKTRLLASILFVLLKCFYLAIVIYAPGLVVAEMTGWPLTGIVLATGLLTTLYTMMGGIRAVIWTDCLQLFVLLGGLVFTITILSSAVDGGLLQVVDQASAAGKLRFFDFSTSLEREFTFWGGIIGGTFFMVSQYGVDQAEIQRFLTTSSVRRSQLAVLSSMMVASAVGLLLFLVGAALFVFYSNYPEKGGLAINPDRVFPKFIIEELPPGVTGLVIASVFAAAMSTASSVLNSLTTVSLSDVYQRLSNRPSSVSAARWLTLAFGFFCTVLGMYTDRFGTILVASSKLINFFGGTLTGVFLLGILVPRANGTGAFLGALVGFAGVFLLSLTTNVSWMWYGVFSAVLAFTTGGMLSLCFPAPTRENTAGLTLQDQHGSTHEQ